MDLWRAAATDILSHPARVCFVLPPILGLAATLSHLSQVGLIKKHGLRLRKGLGQHILTDDNVARKIVGALDLGERDGVIEIGPGLGALTLRVAPAARRVVAVEIDRRFAAALREELNGTGNVEIIEENFLKVDLGEITRSRGDVKTWKLVGNLPYYITSAILMMLVEGREHFQSAVITVQDEFARKACGRARQQGLLLALDIRTVPVQAGDTVHDKAYEFLPTSRRAVSRRSS